MKISTLYAAIDEITDQDTEAVLLLAISGDRSVARGYGDKELILAALESLLAAYDTAKPIPEVYAH